MTRSSTFRIAAGIALLFFVYCVHGQETVKPRPLSLEEYNKTKAFQVKDLDADTYVKFESIYILDRYEMRKPYFVTGDDGLKKRFDLYKLLVKPDMDELGILIYYTNEKGERYTVLLPNFNSPGEVWEQYFEDVHAIDKKEANYVLKMSYILSKELGFQLYKSQNAGKDFKKESATYGNDICFPANTKATLASGITKNVGDLVVGDAILSVDAMGHTAITRVTSKSHHDARNYAITKVTLVHPEEGSNQEVRLMTKVLKATPNHPIDTHDGSTTMGDLKPGDMIAAIGSDGHSLIKYEVLLIEEITEGEQPVFSIECEDGHALLLNEVVVRQK